MRIDKVKYRVVPILKKYGASRAALFGSLVRGEDTKESDVDILVEIERMDMSLLDFVGLKMEIEDMLGKNVDLVEYSAIKPLIKEKILNKQVITHENNSKG